MLKKINKTIYIFGNPLLKEDNLPVRLMPKLKKKFPQINFELKDPSENLNPKNGKLCIIDTVKGISKVTLFRNLDEFETEKIYSLHDFDLGLNLKLLRKIGKLKEVLIFGVPNGLNESLVFRQLVRLIRQEMIT